MGDKQRGPQHGEALYFPQTGQENITAPGTCGPGFLMLGDGPSAWDRSKGAEKIRSSRARQSTRT
jgi:hypothetical protein